MKPSNVQPSAHVLDLGIRFFSYLSSDLLAINCSTWKIRKVIYINRSSDGAMLEDTRCTDSQRAVRRGGSLSTRTFLFFETTNSCRLLVHKISYSWSLCSENIDFGRLSSS